jgi:hypothetical protein
VKKYIPRIRELDPQVDHAAHVFRAYEIATANTVIRGSWEKASFGLVKRNDAFYLWDKEGQIRSSPEFQEVWQFDYPEPQLSQRRREQKGAG